MRESIRSFIFRSFIALLMMGFFLPEMTTWDYTTTPEEALWPAVVVGFVWTVLRFVRLWRKPRFFRSFSKK